MTVLEAHKYIDTLLLEEGVGYLDPIEKDALIHDAQCQYIYRLLRGGNPAQAAPAWGVGRNRLNRAELRPFVTVIPRNITNGVFALPRTMIMGLDVTVTATNVPVEMVWPENLSSRLASSIVAPDADNPIYSNTDSFNCRIYPSTITRVSLTYIAEPSRPDHTASPTSPAGNLQWTEAGAIEVCRQAVKLKTITLRDTEGAPLLGLGDQ